MTSPNDTDGNAPDTTTGGGGDFDGGANDPAYRAPGDGVADADGNAPDTTATPGGSTGEAVQPGPDHTPIDTTVPGNYGDADGYFTGDADNSTPQEQVGDTTQLGGGIGSTGSNPYRAPSDAPPAGNRDTSGQSGVLSVDPSSPDREVVGQDQGVNPNAVEPGLTNSSNSVSNVSTTGYGDGGPSHVPAGTGVPSAPTNVTASALPNRRAVDIHWDAPANAEATGVLRYKVESNTTGTQMVGKDDSYVEFEEGLEGGRTYTFTVFAETANGTGYRSAPSNEVTIPSGGNLQPDTSVAEGIADSRPDAPAAPAAPTATVVSDTSVSVAFTAPKSSEPITGYRVTSSGGQVVEGASSPIVVTGLAASTAYTFTVAAKSTYGYGPESAASASVTTNPPPGP